MLIISIYLQNNIKIFINQDKNIKLQFHTLPGNLRHFLYGNINRILCRIFYIIFPHFCSKIGIFVEFHNLFHKVSVVIQLIEFSVSFWSNGIGLPTDTTCTDKNCFAGFFFVSEDFLEFSAPPITVWFCILYI